jgi:hypothetical protein
VPRHRILAGLDRIREIAERSPADLGAASESFAASSAPDDRPPMTEAHAPEHQAAVDTKKLPAQPLLPGLEPVWTTHHSGSRVFNEHMAHRIGRLRMAPIELWPSPESSGSEIKLTSGELPGG